MHKGGTETLAVGSSVGSSGGRGGERHSTGLMCEPGSAGVSRGQPGPGVRVLSGLVLIVSPLKTKGHAPEPGCGIPSSLLLL